MIQLTWLIKTVSICNYILYNFSVKWLLIGLLRAIPCWGGASRRDDESLRWWKEERREDEYMVLVGREVDEN